VGDFVRVDRVAWTANIASIPKAGVMRAGAAVMNGVIHLLDGSDGPAPHSQLKVRQPIIIIIIIIIIISSIIITTTITISILIDRSILR
jgi:hypothetical protein